jgi:hypothetical protein
MSFDKNDSGRANPATWVDDDEKYALVALSVKLDGYIRPGKITSYLWALPDTKFNVSPL